MRLSLILGLLAAFVIALTLQSCSDQMMTRRYGGKMTYNLSPGQKLEGMTWKGDNLYFLSRPFREGEKPETHTFQESSVHGVWEGTVIVVEHPSPSAKPSPTSTPSPSISPSAGQGGKKA